MPVWVRRDNSFIEICDRGSREFRFDDYSLTKCCLKSVLKNFPKVTVDAMASSTNCIVPKFFSRYPSLNSLGVDLFSQTLDYYEFYFVFPPISFGVNVLKFLASQQARGIFIIPVWSKSIWFNFIFPDGRHCAHWVSKMLIFSPNFEPNLNSSTCFSDFVTYKMAALEFDFKKYSLNTNSRGVCFFALRQGAIIARI